MTKTPETLTPSRLHKLEHDECLKNRYAVANFS